MRTRAFIVSLLVITLAAVAAAWFWALAPITISYEVLSAETDADLVRQLFHFRLVQPEWVSRPPNYDYGRWAMAEALARLSVVFLGWAGIIFAYLKRRRKTQSNVRIGYNSRLNSVRTFPAKSSTAF